MSIIIYGAGNNGLKLYSYLQFIGRDGLVDCFCDRRFEQLCNIDGKPVYGLEKAKEIGSTFVISVEEGTHIYDEIVNELTANKISFFLSTRGLFEENTGWFNNCEYARYTEFVKNKDISEEYFKLRRLLINNAQHYNDNKEVKFVWFMPSFPFLHLILEGVKEQNDVMVIDSWGECLNGIRDLNPTNEYFFVMFEPWIRRLYDLIDFIKKRFSSSHLIWYSYDTKVFKENISKYKDKFDEVFLFDENEAKCSNVSFYPGLYQKPLTFLADHPTFRKIYDVVWCGASYGRLERLVEFCDAAERAGLHCKFVVVDDGLSYMPKRESIEYVTSLSPEKCIATTMSGKCMLELRHTLDSALTIRICEAIAYNKKIITDNKQILKSRYYNPNMILYYEDVDKIDFGFVDKKEEKYNYNGEFLPSTFLDYVVSRFDKMSK